MKKGEDMTREEQEKVELIKQKIIDKQNREERRKNTSFKDSKVVSIAFKNINWLFIRNKQFFLKYRKNKVPAFKGNLLNAEEVEEYEASIGNIPVDSYQTKDGIVVTTYPDNKVTITKVKPCYTLSSVFPNLEVQNQVMEILRKDREERIEYHKKARFSSYLNVSSEEIGQWSWEQIDECILEQVNSPKGVQKLFCKIKRRK